MNILYASDDHYAEPTGISMVSLFENNRDAQIINVYILDSGISDSHKQKLSKLAALYKRKLHYLSMPDVEKIVGTKVAVYNHFTLAAFSRLFAARILPENVDKILYLDSDITVRGSCMPLYETDLTGFMLGGVYIAVNSVAGNARILLKKTDIYINSGVMLLNLGMWRSEQIERKFIQFIHLFEGNVPVVDQGVINGVLSRSIKLVHPKYNCMPFYYSKKYEDVRARWGMEVYTKEIVQEAKENPVIYHFAGFEKPWEKGYDGPFAEEFLRYKAASPWAGTPLRETKLMQELVEKQQRQEKNFKQKIKRIMPKPVIAFIRDIKNSLSLYWHIRKLKKSAKNKGIKLEDCML